MSRYLSNSALLTEDYGRSLAPKIPAGGVVALHGPLGSGKTVLARGLIKGLGYSGPVSSPTYTIVHEYPAGQDGMSVNTAHFDLYRVTGEADLESTGFYDYLNGGWTLILEWCDSIPWAVEPSFVHVYIERTREDNVRIIRME